MRLGRRTESIEGLPSTDDETLEEDKDAASRVAQYGCLAASPLAGVWLYALSSDICTTPNAASRARTQCNMTDGPKQSKLGVIASQQCGTFEQPFFDLKSTDSLLLLRGCIMGSAALDASPDAPLLLEYPPLLP